MSDEPTFDPQRKSAIRNLVVNNAADTQRSIGGRKHTALLVTLVLLAVSISGGTVAYALGTGLLAPKPVVTPTVTPTPTPTPTPTSTPTAAAPVQDPSDPSTWVISFHGIGPVTLGAAMDRVRADIPNWSDETYDICRPGQVDLVAPDGLALTAGITEQGRSDVGDLVIGFNFTANGDPTLATPKTTEGIGVGATLEELMIAYPTIAKTGEYGGVSTYYGLTNGKGTWIVFGVLDGRVDQIQVGPLRTIPSENCPA